MKFFLSFSERYHQSYGRERTMEISVYVPTTKLTLMTVMDKDYTIHEMETIFHKLHGAKCFGKVDLSDVCHQIEFDEELKKTVYSLNPTKVGELFFDLSKLH